MKLSKEHSQAVQDLIKRYRSVTLDEIKHTALEENSPVRRLRMSIKTKLTGFGHYKECSLCCSTICCNQCIHNYTTESSFDYNCILHRTYTDIANARTPTTLLNAYRKRADYLEELLINYKNNQRS